MSAEWVRSAACVGLPEDVFFPPLGGNAAEAKAICAGCPVADHCLRSAMAEEGHALAFRHGVRGGLSPKERHAAANGALRRRSA